MNLLIAVAVMGVDPVVEPWDFEAQLKASPTIQAMQSDIGTIKAKVAAHDARCPCGLSTVPVNQPAAAPQMVMSCANGTCQMVPAQSFVGQFMGSGEGGQSSCGPNGCGSQGGNGRGGGFHPFKKKH